MKTPRLKVVFWLSLGRQRARVSVRRRSPGTLGHYSPRSLVPIGGTDGLPLRSYRWNLGATEVQSPVYRGIASPGPLPCPLLVSLERGQRGGAGWSPILHCA